MDWTCADIREAFLTYFKNQGHETISSSPLVPGNDKTLLFTNAGMVQFKDIFLGDEVRSYTRAASSQRCVRAGGKHNDLENVGYTARHHTFFEMLGNFSFGDYFKKEAIQFAWEFLTQVLELSPERLWITVFEEDYEAAKIWLEEIGVSPERFSRIGAKDNFWSMGDTGPCGPCSEIFYDHGEDIFGGPPGTENEDGDRYIEIWNLVFMQYNRFADGTMEPLPKPSVDTGMGLERIAAILQGVHSNYEIDIFQHLINRAAEITATTDKSNKSLRVIADHIRACAFLIADGVYPANDGRGYVLRRIIRRAIRHGYQLGVTEQFFYRLFPALIEVMGGAYPVLAEQSEVISRVLKQEEEQFLNTLEQGMKILENDLKNLKDKEIPGVTVFKLYDTYGFPVDLTADIAREKCLTIDSIGFEEQMKQQKDQSRKNSNFSVVIDESVQINEKTEFVGYDIEQSVATIICLLKNNVQISQIEQNEHGAIVLDKTPFYAESGGQIGDEGIITTKEGAVFNVEQTQKIGDAFVHIGTVTKGVISVAEEVTAAINAKNRQAIKKNHTATHILHAALRKVLGTHVQQKGSLVTKERLRFDFSHFEPVSKEQLTQIEKIANEVAQTNDQAETKLLSYDEAIESGAMALFGEKYGDKVRVVSLGDFSVELCGGTHVDRAGDIGIIKIISETGIASGVRRIEAVTGMNAVKYITESESKLETISKILKTDREKIEEKMDALLNKTKVTEKELQRLKEKLASKAGGDLASKAMEFSGIKILATTIENADTKMLKTTVDQLKNKLGDSVVVLGTKVDDKKVQLIAGVSKELTKKIKAGDLVNFVAEQVDGRGGGKPEMALAGGSNVEMLDKAVSSAVDWIKEKI
ncbi:MAG: alanine--tRNA ligase [Gammaproteobacteria bacterium]|nr:MAG: alanine--tRNA ligase [Gammaproteobacteria bacterium]